MVTCRLAPLSGPPWPGCAARWLPCGTPVLPVSTAIASRIRSLALPCQCCHTLPHTALLVLPCDRSYCPLSTGPAGRILPA
eukprot:3147279-Rhodomonas_salina.3